MNEFQKKYEKEIQELTEACHRCAELNYVTSSGGNLSLRAAEDVILITPTKTLKRKMRFEDICAVDPDGKIIYSPEGKKPTGEWTRTGTLGGTSALVKYFPEGDCWTMITNTSTWKGPGFTRYTESLFRKCRELYGDMLPAQNLFDQ